MRWVISVPAWGERCVRALAELSAPSLLWALRDLGSEDDVRMLVHTDAPDRVRALPWAWAGVRLETRPVGSKPTYVTLQESHADAVQSAAVGERVVLLNADLVVSRNFLRACARHFDDGALAVVLLGIRTPEGPEKPPIGAAPRDLLEWAWGHRHRIIQDLEWPRGRSMLPTNLFFSVGESTVARGFHLHPAAIVKCADTECKSTIDNDLLDHFPVERVHVVVDPDDCAMCEVSPAERRFPVRSEDMTPRLVAGAMRTRATAIHRWLFAKHRMLVRGRLEEVSADIEVAKQILDCLSGGVDVRARPERRDEARRRGRGRVPGRTRGR